MSNWTCLGIELLFQIYRQLPLDDVVQCQLVCKNWSMPAQHVLYTSIKLDSPMRMFQFLKGQVNDSTAKAAKFIQTIDISQKSQDENIPPELFQLLASRCSNVEHLLGNSNSPLFWRNMMTLVDSSENKYWKNIKCIPYSHELHDSYKICAHYFRQSLTELTIKDDETRQGKTLFKKIATDYPKLRTLEIYDNRILFKNVYDLECIKRYLPDLNSLCLDRGTRARSLTCVREIKPRVRADKNMNSIAIRFKNFDVSMIDYIQRKYPCLKRIKFTFINTILDEKIPPIKRLIKFCISAPSNYQLKFAVKKPGIPLDIYYKLLQKNEPQHLSVTYTVDLLRPVNQSIDYQRAVIDLRKNEHNNKRTIDVYFAHYSLDNNITTQIGFMLKKIGKYLSSLTLRLDEPSLEYLLPDKRTNGHLFDRYIFFHCDKLARLEFHAYSLLSCDKSHPIKSPTVQELIFRKCRMGSILSDLSYRLPNLRTVLFVDCDFHCIYEYGAYCYDFQYSDLESLSILGCRSTIPPTQIYFDLITPVSRQMFFQSDPNSAHLDHLLPETFFKNYNPELVCIRLRCKSIRYVKIAAGSFNVEKYFDTF